MAQLESAEYHEIREAFAVLWTRKELPLDVRKYICGAVQAAGARQGDEVFPREYIEKQLRDEHLDGDELLDMIERTHEFVLEKKALRKQYLLIVLHNTLKHLNENYSDLVKDVERRLAQQAQLN